MRSAKISEYEVNPTAENTVNTVASIILIVGIIIGVILLFGGFVMMGEAGAAAGWGVILTAVVTVIIGVVQWAFLKVLVNISRNLYNVNENIKNLTLVPVSEAASKVASASSSNTSKGQSATAPNAEVEIAESPEKFSAGQLVIIKTDQRQFRIDSVYVQDGKYFYWSEKFQKEFGEDEIEDFEKYWADKKGK